MELEQALSLLQQILPEGTLSKASKQITEGDLKQSVEIIPPLSWLPQIGEVEELAASFNRMSGKLQDSFEALETTNTELESRIEQRTVELRTSLAEKEILLREIHHRVKNNLHVISNLLDLQADSIQDERVLSFLSDSQDRIQAMALIHEHLYQSNHSGLINIDDYIQRLVENLLFSYMDISLQGAIDGITASTQIGYQLQIPVVYMTAYADNSTLERAKSTNPYGYLVKPFKPHDLRVSIEIALQKYRTEVLKEQDYTDQLEDSQAELRQLQRLSEEHRTISVNLSGSQLKLPHLYNQVARILQDTQIDPKFIELELTESTLIEDIDLMVRQLHALKSLGISVAIDDFGTGYSSMLMLHHFPFDILKFDRCFVKNIDRNPKDITIASAIISLAHKLDIKVVAKGVETNAERECLRQFECDEIPGFLISPPIPVPQFLAQISAQD
jgi:EAL domain-containing protein (putative c-di-GMP-specific phosphodiesterase class I)